MLFSSLPLWKEAPFTRLLCPFVVGIIFQWYLPVNQLVGWTSLVISFIFLLTLSLFSIAQRFHLNWLRGLCILSLIFFCGILVSYYKDISNDPAWVNNFYSDNSAVVITLEEPLSEKPRSFKTTASIQQVISNETCYSVKGKIIVYFSKENAIQQIGYGNRLVLFKSLQPIINNGNPASFDYRRYCAFQGIYHQVYLKPTEFVLLKETKKNQFKSFLFSSKQKILDIIRNNISGQKEKGLAEALLLGYKDDLDKSLVTAYANTGVVHVIAISGLHLGLIYWLLSFLLKPFFKRLLKAFFVIVGLWLFSFLAGASPSVLRSAVMFTCIVTGESISRKNSIYNSLAASAFLLLCHNPFWLWDVGFQLSYSAVLSIAVFMKPIYSLCFIQNRLLDAFWKLNAVTVAAQLLTLPLCLYHFNQFPVLFIISNFVAVPLSSGILVGELVMCGLFFFPKISNGIGFILQKLIYFMNSFIEYIDTFPFSIIGYIHINFIQSCLLYISLCSFSYWIFKKRAIGFQISTIGLLLFFSIRTSSFRNCSIQKKLIVYNVPQHCAMDIIDGRNYLFRADSGLLSNQFLQNFHLHPCRVELRLTNRIHCNENFLEERIFKFYGNTILILENYPFDKNPSARIDIDLIIISGNPRFKIADIVRTFNCKKIVFDSSNSPLKIKKWKEDCQKFHLPFHSVADNGAFVMNMD